MNTPSKQWARFEPPPGFSRVSQEFRAGNRFNGFPRRPGEAARATSVPFSANTRQMPSANEMPAGVLQNV